VIFLPLMPTQLSTRLRLLGVLPLIFFLIQFLHYRHYGGLGNLLWMCNAGNVLLGIGLLVGHREAIRAAAIWTIPGLAIWIKYVLLTSGGFYFSTTQAHVGGIIVGMIALRRIGMDERAWLYAFAWYLLTQLAARLFASPELNVNVAHGIQAGWEKTFSSYWKFWMVMTVVVAIGLWVIGKALSLIWPVKMLESRRVGIASESKT
jgi:hypothetical protein